MSTTKIVFVVGDEIMAQYSGDNKWYDASILQFDGSTMVKVKYKNYDENEWLNYPQRIMSKTHHMDNQNEEYIWMEKLQQFRSNPLEIPLFLEKNKYKISSRVKITILNKMYDENIPVYKDFDQVATPLFWLSSNLHSYPKREQILQTMVYLIKNGANLFGAYTEYTDDSFTRPIQIDSGYTNSFYPLRHLLKVYLDLKQNWCYFEESHGIAAVHTLLQVMNIKPNISSKDSHGFETLEKFKSDDIPNEKKLNSLSDDVLIELFWNGIIYSDKGWTNEMDCKRLNVLYKKTYNMYFNELKEILAHLKLSYITNDVIQSILYNLVDSRLL